MSEQTKLILTILCAIVLIVVIVWKVRSALKSKRELVERPGIISNWLSAQQNGKPIFKPVIRFIGLQNTEVELPADDYCEGEPEYPIGTQVMVRINPKKPEFIQVTYP